jgi:hypothetical protein
MRIARILGEPASWSADRPLRPFSLAAVCAALIVLLLPVPQVMAGLSPTHPAIPASAQIVNGSPHAAVAAVHRVVLASVSSHLGTPELKQVIVAATAAPTPNPSPAPQDTDKPSESAGPKSNYIDRMKAAGYDVDLDKYIEMKMQDVTPEYAGAMSQIGFGKLTADQLVSCKIHNITPEFLANLKDRGLEVKTLDQAISYRIFEITPEFVASMKAAGFANLSSEQLLAMRVQGITPEYATAIRQQFPGITAKDGVSAKLFNIDAAFVAEAKAHGFTGLSLEKLVELRMSGILDDESAKK